MHSCRHFFMEETALGSQNVPKALPQGSRRVLLGTFFGLKNGSGQKRDCTPEVPRRLEAFRALLGRLEIQIRR